MTPERYRKGALRWEQEMRRFARRGEWAAAAEAADFAVLWWGWSRRTPRQGPYR